MKIAIPEYVKKALKTLADKGFEAFVAGGAVRDALLGMTPDDWDITTNALVEDVQNLFNRHFDTGIKHGTVTVLVDKKPIEITTYRIEDEYENNRKPKSVRFTSSLDEDLKRRDFTINAMAYNEETGLVDLFGGTQDLKNKTIRCVGNPDERFSEDALRIMRAVRFSARLNFEIEAKTLESIKNNCHLLKNISAERIQSELVKTLTTGSNVDVLFSSGIMEAIAPEIEKCNIDFVNSVDSDAEVKLASLLSETNIDSAREFFNKLKFDNKTKNNTLNILNCFAQQMPKNDVDMRKILSVYGVEIVKKVLRLWQISAGEEYKNTNTLFERNKNLPHTIGMLAIDGNDLISMGIRGTDIGKTMKMLLEEVINKPETNTKSQLLALIDKINNDNRYQ